MKRKRLLLWLAALLLASCNGGGDDYAKGREPDSGSELGFFDASSLPDAKANPVDPDAASPLPADDDTLEIVSPYTGQSFVRDIIGTDGASVAPVLFRAHAGSDIRQVTWFAEDDYNLGTGVPPEFELTYQFHGDGDRWVRAVAFDERGFEVAWARVDFHVVPPTPIDCPSLLTSLGVSYTNGPDMLGVETPVTVTLPINGIDFRYAESSSLRMKWSMDCELAAALWKAGEVLEDHGVTKVIDLGIYNYRCIDQSVAPPDCPGSSLSMHGRALAVDFSALVTGDETTYSIADDWVIDPDSEPTCVASTSGGKDAFLHEVLCDLYAAHVFNIYLSPNYNGAHRNHWHMDLTPDADFLEYEFPHDVMRDE